jgi:hypothetical protein
MVSVVENAEGDVTETSETGDGPSLKEARDRRETMRSSL